MGYDIQNGDWSHSNNDWQEDERLKEALTCYVRENLRRNEVLDFVSRDFSDYAWSLRMLERRLQYFGITYTDRTVQVDEVVDAVKQEMQGPGKLLGYRALHKKLGQVHDLNVPRDLVYAVMYNVDPEALAERAPQYKKKKAKGNFISQSPNWVHSLDGHDKLMGYQNSTFPIAVYGCMDTCSRKMLWAKVWVSNSNPDIIGRFYLEYLFKSRTIASKLRLDKGSETGVMAAIHAFLRQHHGDMDPLDTVMYGPSTSNQVCSCSVFLVLPCLCREGPRREGGGLITSSRTIRMLCKMSKTLLQPHFVKQSVLRLDYYSLWTFKFPREASCRWIWAGS